MPCSRIQRRRARATSARSRSAACRLFFEGDVVPVEKTPQRTAAGSYPPPAQFHNRLHQGQVRLFRNQPQYLRSELLQRRNASTARPRLGAPAVVPALQPPHRGRHTDPEQLGCLTSRRPLHLHHFDRALPQVTRIGLRHRPPPKGESMRKDSLIHRPLGISPIQIGRKPL